jgi:hypothetical protein
MNRQRLPFRLSATASFAIPTRLTRRSTLSPAQRRVFVGWPDVCTAWRTMSRTRLLRSGPSFANPWVIFALVVQIAAALASTYGFAPLLLAPAALMAICCLIGGGDWAIRGSPAGILVVVVGIASPAFILWYPRHLGHFVRDHMAEYQAAIPTILAADAAHCPQTDKLPETCPLQDLLPSEFRTLARSIWVYSDGKPAVFFKLVHDRHGYLVYAPGWSTPRPAHDIYRSLGGGWYTTLPGLR